MILGSIFALTVEVIGTLMIAFAALRVHHRVLNEHKIDKQVFAAMKRERKIGITGVFFVVVGYIVEVTILLVFR